MQWPKLFASEMTVIEAQRSSCLAIALTSLDKACMQIRRSLDKYLALTRMINAESGALTVFVPRMMGIDEGMRDWSFFMILEHNAIVNRSITSIVQSLVRAEEPKGPGGSRFSDYLKLGMPLNENY